jgi:hypothetical protein
MSAPGGNPSSGFSSRISSSTKEELAPVVRGNGYFDAIISAADLLGA